MFGFVGLEPNIHINNNNIVSASAQTSSDNSTLFQASNAYHQALKDEETKVLSILSSVGATNPIRYGNVTTDTSETFIWNSPPIDPRSAGSLDSVQVDMVGLPPTTAANNDNNKTSQMLLGELSSSSLFDLGIPNIPAVMSSSAMPFTDSQNYWAEAFAEIKFQCGGLKVDVQSKGQSEYSTTPPKATEKDMAGFFKQMNSTAHSLEATAKADVEGKAKSMAQGFVSNSLCDAEATATKCPSPLIHATSMSDVKKPSLPHPIVTKYLQGTASFPFSSTSSRKYYDYSSGQIVKVAGADGSSSTTTSSHSSSSSSSLSAPSDIFQVKTFDKPPWKFTYQVIDKQGLVLRDIKAGNQTHFKSVSVPHFEIGYSNGTKNEFLRFDAKCDIASEISGPTEDPSRKGVYTLTWGFKKTFDRDDLKGTLSINYEIVIRSDPSKCEFVGKIAALNCFRFIPKLSYDWQGSTPQTLEEFTAFYRLDYGPVGIALDRNENWALLNFWANTGRLEILTHETSFIGVYKGKAGSFDNIHTANVGEDVFVPGCRFANPFKDIPIDIGSFPPFDCNHIHWRWAATGVISTDPKSWFNWGPTPNVDVMVEPSTDQPIPEELRGQPYLVPGQTIQVAVVKERANEEDPDYPFSTNVGNTILLNDEIAKTKACHLTPSLANLSLPKLRSPDSCQLVSAEPVRIWYGATSYNKNSDTYFRHGSYAVDLKHGYDIKSALQSLRSDLGSVINSMGTVATTTPVVGTSSNITTTTSAANNNNVNNYQSYTGLLLPPPSSLLSFPRATIPSTFMHKIDLDKNKLNEVLANLDQSLSSKYWLSNGTISPAHGTSVFAALSRAAELMQEIKKANMQDNQTASLMDGATSHLLLSVHYLLLNTMNNGLTALQEQTITSPSHNDKSKINSLISNNEALSSSRAYYMAATNESDVSNSPQIINNFGLAWNSTITGMKEVFAASGMTPPDAIATSTTNNGTSLTNGTTTRTATTTSLPLTPGWDVCNNTVNSCLSVNDADEQLDFAKSKVSYAVQPQNGNNSTLSINYQLYGARANEKYTVGIHVFWPSSTSQCIGGFGHLAEGGSSSSPSSPSSSSSPPPISLAYCNTYTRQGSTRVVESQDLGTITTDGNGNGNLSVNIQGIPSGTYEMEFHVRKCASCVGTNPLDVIFQSPGPVFGAKGSTVFITIP